MCKSEAEKDIITPCPTKAGRTFYTIGNRQINCEPHCCEGSLSPYVTVQPVNGVVGITPDNKTTFLINACSDNLAPHQFKTTRNNRDGQKPVEERRACAHINNQDPNILTLVVDEDLV